MRKRLWTVEDDDDLRRLYAQGWSDGTLGAMLARQRAVVGRRREKLGLGPPRGVSGPPKGYKRSAEACQKVTEANRKRWRDPESNERMLLAARKNLAKARIAAEARRLDKPWSCAGYKRSAKARAAVSKRQKERYASDPAYRERMQRMTELAKKAPRHRLIPIEKKWIYEKIRAALGKEKARELLLEGAL